MSESDNTDKYDEDGIIKIGKNQIKSMFCKYIGYGALDYEAYITVELTNGQSFDIEYVVNQWAIQEFERNQVTDFFVEWLSVALLWASAWNEENYNDIVRKVESLH